jgi:hypothetical protein
MRRHRSRRPADSARWSAPIPSPLRFPTAPAAVRSPLTKVRASWRKAKSSSRIATVARFRRAGRLARTANRPPIRAWRYRVQWRQPAATRGVGLALLVEVLAAAATGATPSIDASPFSGTAGGPPRTGQFCIALSEFASRIDRLVSAFADQPGAHLPCSGRQQKRRQAPLGIRLTAELVVRARQLAGA